MINKDNYESFFLRYIEGRLSESEQKELEAFLLQNPETKELLELYDPMLTLEKDESLTFDKKETLYKHKKVFVMPKWVEYAAVAAVALLMVSIGMSKMEQLKQATTMDMYSNTVAMVDPIQSITTTRMKAIIEETAKKPKTTNFERKRKETPTASTSATSTNETIKLTVDEYLEAMEITEDFGESMYLANNTIPEGLGEESESIIYIEECSFDLAAYIESPADSIPTLENETFNIEYTTEYAVVEESGLYFNKLSEKIGSIFLTKKDEIENEITEYKYYIDQPSYLEEKINQHIVQPIKTRILNSFRFTETEEA